MFFGGHVDGNEARFKFVNIAGVVYSELVMSLEPQWLVIISLIQNKNKNEYDSTVTNLLRNDAVNRWLKNPREGQYGIVFLINTFSGEK